MREGERQKERESDKRERDRQRGKETERERERGRDNENLIKFSKLLYPSEPQSTCRGFSVSASEAKKLN